MRIRGQLPKLGALQRWVRECDAVLTPKMSQKEENEIWEVLDAILRTTQPEFISSGTSTGGTVKEGTRLRWYDPFIAGERSESVAAAFLDSQAISDAAITVLRPLQTIPGPERRPPNKHPAIIYFSPPNTFPLLSAEDRVTKPARHDVPGVPGAFVITNVFERAECEYLVKAAEKVGLQADEPVAGSAAELASVLAHNLIWLADPDYLSVLFGRIVGHLPPVVHGGAVKGINARFRLYRYRPGALYRPHVRAFDSTADKGLT